MLCPTLTSLFWKYSLWPMTVTHTFFLSLQKTAFIFWESIKTWDLFWALWCWCSSYVHLFEWNQKKDLGFLGSNWVWNWRAKAYIWSLILYMRLPTTFSTYCIIWFKVMLFFLGKFTEPIAWLSQWWAFTSQLVPLSQQDYLPESPHRCEKNRTTQHKTMRITIWPFAISATLSGFHFPA